MDSQIKAGVATLIFPEFQGQVGDEQNVGGNGRGERLQSVGCGAAEWEGAEGSHLLCWPITDRAMYRGPGLERHPKR